MRHLLLLLAVLLPTALSAQAPSVTQHTVTVDGRPIRYTATSGYLDLTTESGDVTARIFHTSYVRSDVQDKSTRPITFVFNGGPGSSSVWLHMGGLGPRIVVLPEDGSMPEPPFRVAENPHTWLTGSDLVFIDPVSTGYSRAADPAKAADFHGYVADIESVGDFIRRWTLQNNRWGSPKYLAGESYGTTRAAGLAQHLQDRHGMYINGVMLISSILDFSTARFDRGNQLPYFLFLPTYTATAWYHKRLDSDLQLNLWKTLNEVRQFAMNDYAPALLKGDQLPADERARIASMVARYTGLSIEYVEDSNLRIDIGRFTKELTRDQGRTVGRLDSRFQGMDYDDAGERYEYDPSYDGAIYGPFTGAFMQYVRNDLKFESDLPYEILTGRVQPWNYRNVQNRYLNVAEDLRRAMHRNPYLKVWVANGYYDLATPFFATEYTFSQMNLDPTLKRNVTFTYYESGHMMYIHRPSLVKFHRDFMDFITN